ncbi:MAG: L,D-transpeptidase family protein [Pseudomonadota bacterium]
MEPSATGTQATPGTPVVAAPAPLSAEASALKTALEQRFGRDSTATAAYAARGFSPIWLDDAGAPSEAARVLISVLEKAGDHALPSAKYRGATLKSRLESATPGPAFEIDLTAAFVDYAQDLSSGLLKPRQIDRELHIYPERPDAGVLIRAASSSNNIADYLDSLIPADPLYRRLMERYATFRSIAGSDIWGAPVRAGRTLRPGERNSRVAEARARLTAMGDLDPNVYDQQATASVSDGTQIATNDITTDVPVRPFDETHFDEPMVAALQSFQARHGLNLDGVIGPATLKQLNVSPRTRANQIAVTLERLRWMNKDLGDRHVLVNLAGFEMAVMHNGRPEFESRVVIGKARKHRTPEFSDLMTHMVINPSWYVPKSIAVEEIMPKVRADPDYLARKNMRLLGPNRIVQGPGRGNALGTVKFMFPNQWAIYLHDTPSKRLFKRDVRAFSHGCVRVERPHEFAEHLLTAQQDDPGGYFRRILNRGRERRVDLDEPLPVHLTYRTAWIDENGVEQFRGDIYGRDRKIAEALTAAGVTVLQ